MKTSNEEHEFEISGLNARNEELIQKLKTSENEVSEMRSRNEELLQELNTSKEGLENGNAK